MINILIRIKILLFYNFTKTNNIKKILVILKHFLKIAFKAAADVAR